MLSKLTNASQKKSALGTFVGDFGLTLAIFEDILENRNAFLGIQLYFQGLLFIVFTANMRQRGRIHLATFKQGKKVKTLQTINEASQISAIKG